MTNTAQAVMNWIDERFPLTSTYKAHLSEYYAPKNFNFWYFFGSLALMVLVIQILTGIFLVMHYKPDASLNGAGVPVAFASVEYIMRDVPGGWLIRYMHSTGPQPSSSWSICTCSGGCSTVPTASPGN